MPLWLFLLLDSILLFLTLLFLVLFFKVWKTPKKKKEYPKYSIRKFLQGTSLTIYLLFSIFCGLSVIAISSLFFV